MSWILQEKYAYEILVTHVLFEAEIALEVKNCPNRLNILAMVN